MRIGVLERSCDAVVVLHGEHWLPPYGIRSHMPGTPHFKAAQKIEIQVNLRHLPPIGADTEIARGNMDLALPFRHISLGIHIPHSAVAG